MAYSDLILAHANLQSYYQLGDSGGTAVDSGPAALNGTYKNSPTVVAGLVRDQGNAHQFVEASDHWVDLGDIHDFAGVASFSIEAWIQPGDPAGAGATPRIVSKESDVGIGGDGGHFFYWLESGELIYLRRHNADGGDAANSPVGSVPRNAISHVVGTYDGSDMRVYVNGKEEGSAPSSRSLAGNPESLAIGCEVFPAGGTTWHWEGIIDHVAIYDAALSAQDILGHYDAGKIVTRRRCRNHARRRWWSM